MEPTAQAIAACELPLLEDPLHLLSPESLVREDFVRWPEAPPVMALGWLSYTYFPRSAMFGILPLVYDGEHMPPSVFHEVRSGDLHEAAVRPERPVAERLGVGVAQSASIGMRAAAVASGDSIVLNGLHPREPQWSFLIPLETPRMVARFAGEEPIAMPPPRSAWSCFSPTTTA